MVKRYQHLRPKISARGLIAPGKLNDDSTIFIHRQTSKIDKARATYMSSLEFAMHEIVTDNEEQFNLFLDYLSERRVYIIEDWDSVFTTVEVLMYDHGLKGPNDGTEAKIFKGECDAAFDRENKVCRLSLLIWNGNKIVSCEVYQGIGCADSIEAECFAAFALLERAKELGIEKLLLCTDCIAVHKAISGEMPIKIKTPYSTLYLMLRSMRRNFMKLITMWKPRELMPFVDDLAKDDNITSPLYGKEALLRWAHLLKGLPVFRVEQIKPIKRIIEGYGEVKIKETYGYNKNSIFFVEVEEEDKFQCLVDIKKAFKPKELFITVNLDGKPADFENRLQKLSFEEVSKVEGCFTTFKDSALGDAAFSLVVVFDAKASRKNYNHESAFHIILATPREKSHLGKSIPELSALSYIYFNGVRGDVNEEVTRKDNKSRSK